MSGGNQLHIYILAVLMWEIYHRHRRIEHKNLFPESDHDWNWAASGRDMARVKQTARKSTGGGKAPRKVISIFKPGVKRSLSQLQPFCSVQYKQLSSVQTTELEGPLFWSSSHHSHPEIVSETLNQTKSETSLSHWTHTSNSLSNLVIASKNNATHSTERVTEYSC